MGLSVVLSSCGNPDFGQDPDRSMPGVPNREIEVADFADASRLCRQYIEDYDLGGGNWTGGTIFEQAAPLGKKRASDAKPIAKVSYNGNVWALPERMNAAPLYSPHQAAPASKAKDPLDAFKWEEVVIDVPGYGGVIFTGSFRTASCKSLPDKFLIGKVPHEFITGGTVGPGGFEMRDLGFHPNGLWDQSVHDKKAEKALVSAITTWLSDDANMAMVRRNELKDKQQEVFVLERNIGYTETKLQEQRDEAAAKRAELEAFESEMENSGLAPKF